METQSFRLMKLDSVECNEDIIHGLGPIPFNAQAVSNRDELLAKLKGDARPGDCVLVMGARDPSLPSLVMKTAELFGGERGKVRH